MPDFLSNEDLLTKDTIYLLSEEDNNLASYREYVEKNKAKVQSDIDFLLKEISNILEESKIKIMEELDEHYKLFVHKYRDFKQEVISFKNVKLDFIYTALKHQNPIGNLDMHIASNGELLRELDDIRQKFHASRIHQAINNRTKEFQMQINHLSKEILQILSSAYGLYKSENMNAFFREIKTNLHEIFNNKFQNIEDIVKPIPSYLPGNVQENASFSNFNFPIMENQSQQGGHFENNFQQNSINPLLEFQTPINIYAPQQNIPQYEENNFNAQSFLIFTNFILISFKFDFFFIINSKFINILNL